MLAEGLETRKNEIIKKTSKVKGETKTPMDSREQNPAKFNQPSQIEDGWEWS